MRKLFLCTLGLSLVIGCKKQDNFENNGEKFKTEFIEKTQNLDERYVGDWKLINANVANKPDDGSMNGIICKMEKYPNSDGSYVFHLFTGHELTLTKETDNHLVGQNANMNADYDENYETLKISIPKGSSWTFKKIR